MHTAPSEPGNFSVRVVLHWRGPRPTLETSGDAWADRACLAGRPCNRPRLTGRPGIVEARAPLFLVLLYMPAAARLGLDWCDDRNHRQRRGAYDKCQKPDRKLAHRSLLRILAIGQRSNLLWLNVSVS